MASHADTTEQPTAALSPIPAAAWRRAFDAPADPGHRPKQPDLSDGGALQGCPLGGLGTGGIGRDWRGSFRRWTLKPGALKHFTEPANGFGMFQQPAGGASVALMLAPRDRDDPDALDAWAWPAFSLDGYYAALFPKAWYVYRPTPAAPVEMVCEQFSPVLPGQVDVAALPVAVFRWHLRNTATTAVTVGLMFSFANLNGWFEDFATGKPSQSSGGNFNAPLDAPCEGGRLSGVVFDHARMGTPPGQNRGQWAIAAPATERIMVKRAVTFDALGRGEEIWRAFSAMGAVPEDDRDWMGAPGFGFGREHTLGGALSATVTLAPGETLCVPMTLVWDLPVVQFGLGRRHYRWHVREFGRGGDNAELLAVRAIDQAEAWSAEIDRWHALETEELHLPDVVHRMLFNELYLMVDGFVVLTDGPVEADDPAPPFFGVIECPDYPYYNTLDLWVYGSFAVLHLWPELEKQTIRMYADQVMRDGGVMRRCQRYDRTFQEVSPGLAPHDLGAPREDPPVLINAYTYQDPTIWKDQPAFFVLTVCRDVLALNDDELLAHCWPAVAAALDRLAAYDRDGDGLIENDGIPDQTFDNIPMLGPSADCGGLWLAALAAGCRLGERVGAPAEVERWSALLAKGREAFDAKLWNESGYYLWDTESAYRDVVFIEQLFGIWYARHLGLGEIAPEEKAVRALKTICARNLDALADGSLGAVNITGRLEAVRESAAKHGDWRNQSDEVLVGINLSLANQLHTFGLGAEAGRVWQAIHRAVYEERGLWFRTPAAYDPEEKTFRAIMNMRPLVIWALAHPGEPASRDGT